MTDDAHAHDDPPEGVAALVFGPAYVLRMIPDWLIGLIARLAAATPFWFSGQTKLATCQVSGEGAIGFPPIDYVVNVFKDLIIPFFQGGCAMSDTTVFLFEEEYKVPLLSPELAATLATLAEHALPILLVFGLFSRYAALGLFIMTMVIQFFVYPMAWPTHILWVAVLLYVMARGPGALSLDHLLWRRHA